MSTSKGSTWLRILLLVLSTGVAFGCTLPMPSAGQSATTVEIIVPNFPQLVEPLKATLDADFAKRTGITVTFVPVGDTSYVGVDQRIQSDLAAGRQPELALIGLNMVRTYADAKRSQPLDKLLDSDRTFDQSAYYAPLFGLGRVGNGMYAMPIAVSTYVLYYNADIFRRAGLDPERPPATFGELRTDARAIVETKAATYGVALRDDHLGDYGYQNFLNSAGGSYMDSAEQTVTLDSSVGQSVISYWRGLYSDGLGRPMPNAQLAQAFLNGDVGMIFQSSSYSATLETGASFEVRSAPHPIPDGAQRKAVVGGAAVAMFSTSDAKQQAEWQVIKEMVGARGVANVVTASGYSPVNKIAATGEGYLASYLTEHPLAKAGWDQLDDLAPWYSFPGSHANEISQALQKEINLAVTGEEPVDVALHTAADKARSLLR